MDFNQFGDSDLESMIFSRELSRIGKRVEEPSWNMTRVQAFTIATDNSLRQILNVKYKVEWEPYKDTANDEFLRVTVYTTDYGMITGDIPIALLKAKTAPADLPMKVASMLQKRLNTKIEQSK